MKNKNTYAALITGSIAAEIIMIAGYFVYAMLILGNGLSAAASIPGNVIRGIVGIIVAVALYAILEKAFKNRV